MQEILAFAAAHWVLSTLFMIVLTLIVVLEVKLAAGGGVSKLSPQELAMYLNHEKCVVLDVRPEVAHEAGHILGAVSLPVTHFAEKQEALLKKHKKDTVILLCEMGTASPKFAKQIKAAHPDRVVYILAGGMSAWQQAQYPVVTSKTK